MTISERRAVNTLAMRQLSERVEAMIAAGAWDESAWNAALDEAAAYANGVDGARDWLLHEAQEAWVERRVKTWPSPYA